MLAIDSGLFNLKAKQLSSHKVNELLLSSLLSVQAQHDTFF